MKHRLRTEPEFTARGLVRRPRSISGRFFQIIGLDPDSVTYDDGLDATGRPESTPSITIQAPIPSHTPPAKHLSHFAPASKHTVFATEDSLSPDPDLPPSPNRPDTPDLPIIGCQVREIRPPAGFPPGRVRFTVRGEHEEVLAFLKTPDGIALYRVCEKGDGRWHPWGDPFMATRRFTIG